MTVQSDGLTGEWLSLEEVRKLEFFQGTDRDFRIKLDKSFFGTRPPSKRKDEAETPSPDPNIKAAVKRHYQSGDIICKAGEYGSTAFLMLEGTAVAEVPTSANPAAIRGRRPSGLQRLVSMFDRRSRSRAKDPDEIAVGEVSAFAASACDRPLRQHLKPGDFFGIDACINFYPREATVRAEQDCVVLEMLRSLVDSVRQYGDFGEGLTKAYHANAVRTQLAVTSMFDDLDEQQMTELAGACELLTPEAPAIRKGVVYSEGDVADALYLVRAGNIRLTKNRPEGELVLAYLGRGSVFGFEGLVSQDDATRPLALSCPSHSQQFGVTRIGEEVTFGRNAGSTIVFPRERRDVGRNHCRIELRGDELFLLQGPTESLTLLNGEPISEALLVQGDRVTIADYTFEVDYADPDPTSIDAPPLRRATACGLDNFEIIKVDRKQLKRLALGNERLFSNLTAAARSLRATAVPHVQPQAAVTDDLLRLDLYNSQNVLLIDLDRCTRCDECVRACADAHDGVTRFTRDGPRFGKYLVTMACRSCTDPKCMIGCPVGSIRRDASLEIRIEDWCIGCQTCAKQCPFGNINMVNLLDDSKVLAPEAVDSPIDLCTKTMRAVVCDLCAGYDGPNCVYACPHDAAIRVNPAAFLAPEDLR